MRKMVLILAAATLVGGCAASGQREASARFTRGDASLRPPLAASTIAVPVTRNGVMVAEHEAQVLSAPVGPLPVPLATQDVAWVVPAAVLSPVVASIVPSVAPVAPVVKATVVSRKPVRAKRRAVSPRFVCKPVK